MIPILFALLVGAVAGFFLAHIFSRKREAELGSAFQALSTEALAKNNQLFLDLAKTNLEKFQESAQTDLKQRQEAISDLVKPVKTTLDKFEGKIHQLEKARTDASASLREQMQSLTSVQQQLQQETAKLSSALKATAVRGRWGEIQLRRVVELAGMLAHCDFYEQQTAMGEEGRKRPDLLVRLPSDRVIVVDAKVPLDAYMEANEAQEGETRTTLMKKHADDLRSHIKLLAGKNSIEHFKPSPEFVVLFLPGETFFSAALAEDPSLIELGASKGVIIATPTTLIALLRAVFYGWRQESISRNAQKINELGRELYRRLSVVSQHWGKVGKSLEGAVRSYNEAVGSLERRFVSKAREFEKLDLGAAQEEALEPLAPIESIARPFQVPELTE